MNSPVAPMSPTRAPRRALGLLAILVLACACAVVWGLASFVRLGSDARALRNAVFTALDAQSVSWRQQVEARAGSITLWAVRAGLAFVRMPDETRKALAAARGAEVGVYELSRDAGKECAGPIASAADQAMAARGWDRLVSVAGKGEWVAVYTPHSPSGELQACVAVLNGRNLVVGKATGRLEPLVELIASRESHARRFLEDLN